MAAKLFDVQTSSGWPLSGAAVVTSASDIIESLAIRSSHSIYVYDLAAQYSFGSLSKSLKDSHIASPQIIDVQTRAGAGLAIVGRMSEGTSAEGSQGSFILSAFTNPEGLSQMLPSLSSLPTPTSKHRVVLNVPVLHTIEGSFALSPSIAPLAPFLADIQNEISVLASASPQEAADLAALSYTASDSHIIHLFDHFASGRELRKLSYPSLPGPGAIPVTLIDGLKAIGYNPFDYHGSDEATDVVVVINGYTAEVVKLLLTGQSATGVVTVRLVRPWNISQFLAILPSSVKRIHVLDDVPNRYIDGPLYLDVISSFYAGMEGQPQALPLVTAHRIVPEDLRTYAEQPSAFKQFISHALHDVRLPTTTTLAENKKLIFHSAPTAALDSVISQISTPFLKSQGIRARALLTNDAFSKPGGASLTRLILSSRPQGQNSPEDPPVDLLLPLKNDGLSFSGASANLADFTGIVDDSLLKTHDILHYAQYGSPVLVYTAWTPDELVANLPSSSRFIASQRELKFYVFDVKKVFTSDGSPVSLEVQRALAHVAFLRLYIGGNQSQDVLARVSKGLLGATVDDVPIEDVVKSVWNGVSAVNIPKDVDTLVSNTKGDRNGSPQEPASPQPFTFNSISLDTFTSDGASSSRDVPTAAPWHEAAKHLIFSDAFSPSLCTSGTEPSAIHALRPELPTKTYLVTCTLNKRLTPKTYNRNVFHMEFDTTGTGLTYKVGEALGIHGWNDEQDVLDFCKWYGVDPDLSINIPVANTSPPQKTTRTVLQALQQQIDIFGKPPKSFYAALATYARDKRDRMALLFIAAPEGTATLKKLGEVDTVSYADVLRLYPSAKPSIEELAIIVGGIKERHYSIASAQSVVGNRVDLLVVTVDWVTPSGTPKYGQCTRYLAALKPGSKVTVSIKPSVMKLPPSDLQPIIMAGLGTGAAPFRAFMQHRALLMSQGKPVGPMLYYFGSRHRSQEYLYGEEIEAYIKDSVITHAGLAFSRDADSKVYIQHKMLQDGELLAGLMGGEGNGLDTKGVFYLCGPTWPVPDVFEVLVKALVQYTGREKENAMDYLESLKEEERYVLEVY